MDGSDKNGCGRKCYHDYNNKKTVGRPDLSQICNMKLMDAQITIDNKDILIKMLQDQLKKIEGMYKKNMSETEEIRYKYCVASNQLDQMQQEKSTKKPCRHVDQVEIELQEEMLKLMNQQSSSTAEWTGLKERLDALGQMIVVKHEELNDKIEKIAGQRYTTITHKTVIPGTKNDAKSKADAAVQVGQVADQFLETARAATEVHPKRAPNVDLVRDFSPNEVCVIESFNTIQDSNFTGSFVDDTSLMAKIKIARENQSEEFVPEYNFDSDPESKEVEENNEQLSMTEILVESEQVRMPRVSIDNRELFRRLTEEDRRSSLSSGGGGQKKRSVIFQGVYPSDEFSPEYSNVVVPPEVQHPELASSDLPPITVEFRKLQSDVYQIKSTVQKLEVINRNCELQIEKLSNVLSNQSQSTKLKFEEHKSLTQELLKENLIVHNELRHVKQSVERLKRQSLDSTTEFKTAGDPLISIQGSLESDITIDRVFHQIGMLFEEECIERVYENASVQIVSHASANRLASSVDIMMAVPNSSSTESEVTVKIHRQIEQIRKRNAADQGAGFVEQVEKVESKDLGNEHKDGSELGITKEVEEKREHELEAEQQDEKYPPSTTYMADYSRPIYLWNGEAVSIGQFDINSKSSCSGTASSDSLRNLTNKTDSDPSQQLSGVLMSDTYSNTKNANRPSTGSDHRPQHTRESKSEPFISSAYGPSSGEANSELFATAQSVLPNDQNEFSRNPTATTPDEEYLQYYIGKVIEENDKLETTINDLLENVRGKIDELNQDKVNAEPEFPESCKSDQSTQVCNRDVTKEVDLTLEDLAEQESVKRDGNDKLPTCSHAPTTPETASGPVSEPAVSDCDNFDVVLSKFCTEDDKVQEEQKRTVLDTLESYSLYLQEQLLVTKKIEKDVQDLKGTAATNNE